MLQLLILIPLITTTMNHVTTHNIRSRCHSDFNFQISGNYSNQVYRESWQRNCSTHVESICTKNITISYFEMEPFTRNTIINKFNWLQTGIIQRILSVALAQCCGKCIRLKFNKVDNWSELIATTTKEESDILLPVFSSGTPHQLNASLPAFTVPILQLPGAMFITKSTMQAKVFAKELITAILDIWPLLGTSIILAFAAGVFMWIFDTWWNKEHFPRRFLTGSFEGFWWAFVSMTTVGYGDRAPKSVPGRLFAVFWILCGITIMSLMTAALTTAIGVVAARQKATVDNGRVGILHNHIFEKVVLMRGNAEKIYKNNINDLVSSILNNDIDAMLIDSLTAKTFKNHLFRDKELFLDRVIHDIDQSYLGITIYDENLHSLLNEYLEFHRDAIQEYIYDVFKSFDNIKNDKVIANLIFTTDSGVFWPTVYTGLFIIGLSLLIGVTYEIYRWQKKSSEQDQLNKQELTLKIIKKQEKKMEEELTALLKQWEKKLLELMKGYSLRGVLSKTSSTHANIILKLTPTELDKLGLPDMDYKDSKTPKRDTKLKLKNKKSKIANGHYEPLEGNNSPELEKNESQEIKKKPKSKKTVVKKVKKIKKSKTSPMEYRDSPEPEQKQKEKKKKNKSREGEAPGKEETEMVPRTRRLLPLNFSKNDEYV